MSAMSVTEMSGNFTVVWVVTLISTMEEQLSYEVNVAIWLLLIVDAYLIPLMYYLDYLLIWKSSVLVSSLLLIYSRQMMYANV